MAERKRRDTYVPSFGASIRGEDLVPTFTTAKLGPGSCKNDGMPFSSSDKFVINDALTIPEALAIPTKSTPRPVCVCWFPVAPYASLSITIIERFLGFSWFS